MNLGEIGGSFEGPVALFLQTIQIYLKYDYDVVNKSNTLVCDQFVITVKQSFDTVIVTLQEKKLTWNLRELLYETVEFPIVIEKGQAKNVFVKESLSTRLRELKQEIGQLSSPTKKAKVDTESESRKGQAETKSETRKEQVEPLQSARVHSSNTFYSSGMIPHGVGIPQVPTGMIPHGVPQIGSDLSRPHARYGVGDVDLDPFRASPGLVPPGIGGMHPGGGMFVGPDHPMFQPPSSGSRIPPGPPPGARFDPVMPFGPTVGRPQRPGRNQPPFSGDPDFDEYLPPGNRDPFL